MKITVIGAGKMGSGLAMRFAMAGHAVTIASFDLTLAEEAAAAAREKTGRDIRSGLNAPAAAWAEMVVMVVPVSSRLAILEELRDILRQKVFVDVTIPMAFDPIRYAPPAEGSNAQQTYAVLGDGSHVAAGFHTVSFTLLRQVETPLTGSTFIVGSDPESVQAVMALAESIGLRAVNAGGLEMAPTVESLTPMLLGINKRYGVGGAGIDITGL